MAEPASELTVLLFAGRFEVRGSSAYTLRLARNLSQYGIRPRIICSDARRVASSKKMELSIQEYGALETAVWGRVVMELMRRELAGDPPDLIHIQSRSIARQGMWLARALQRPSVLTVHDYVPEGEHIIWDEAHGGRIIAVSQSVQSELLDRMNVPRPAVELIHSGVDVPPEAEALPVLAPDHIPVVGTAGPLEAVKGFPFFLQAAREVLAAVPNVEFLIAGAGPEETSLRRQADELEISDHVTFVPNLFDFSQCLAAMDVFCLPSLRQGLGTIMLEAMARGKPVIASSVGGVYSIVRDGETGLMVPPRDSRRLAGRILELLRDPERARTIGTAGRQEVREEFDVDIMVRRTAELYRDILREGERRSQAETAS